jgi:oligosaccharide repeat unit polymerase
MIITLTLFFGFLTILLGRWLFGKWFNHVGLYGAIWSCSLALFHADLVPYYPLTFEAWLVIIVGWIGFVLGSASIVCARFAIGKLDVSNGESANKPMEPNLRVFTFVLWVLNVVVIFDMINLIHVISNLISGWGNFFGSAVLLYTLRTSGGIPGAIPYLSAAALAGCLLGGIYIAYVGRTRIVALIPSVVIFVDSILSMDRGTIVIAAVLFVSGYALGKRRRTGLPTSLPGTKIRRIASIVVGVTLLVTGLEFVRSSRGILEGTFAAGSLSRMKGASFITPSIYFYITGHFGVLNQYLKKDAEQNIVGRYTLAPVWRTIAKLGFETKVGSNQPFYHTPFVGNNGTYLRELHADYGLTGVAVAPFALGAIVSGFWFRALKTGKLRDKMILGHTLIFVAMSIFQVVTQQGSWLASLIFGLILSHAIDRKSTLKNS